jgi:hypothetical protein
MPLQKGKKRKRVRRRGPSVADDGAQPAPVQEKRAAGPVARRRGWQPPLAFNLIFGVVMVSIGVIFFVIPQKGMGTQSKLLLLILYLGLGGLSLGRAYRQYRAKHPR